MKKQNLKIRTKLTFKFYARKLLESWKRRKSIYQHQESNKQGKKISSESGWEEGKHLSESIFSPMSCHVCLAAHKAAIYKQRKQ